MAKPFVIDAADDTRVPFLRGILTRSLQDAGLSFEQAYKLASLVRNELEDRAEITVAELRETVNTHLAGEFDDKVAERYNAPAGTAIPVLVTSGDALETPFSVARLQRCLESSGLTTEEARSTSTCIYQRLIEEGVERIGSNELGRRIFTHLLDDYRLGPAVARRYLAWLGFQRSGHPLILLIGGTTGCGKSTIATELATRLDIVRTQSTDMLREVMRMMIPERLLPVLHTSSFDAWRKLPRHGNEQDADPDELMADGYRAQAELLAVPCEAVVNRALRERISLILEGVHVHPSLLERIPPDSEAVVIPITVAVLKPEQLRAHFRGRSKMAPGRRSERYIKNFAAIWRLQSYLLSEADRTGIAIIANEDKEKTIQELMLTILEHLSKKFSATPEEVFR